MNEAMGEARPAAIVELTKVSKIFEETGTRIELFRELDFAVHAGDFLAIMGASGVGKSTLLHILGLLDHPTSGIVRFRGKDISGLSDRALSGVRGKEIGFVFQFHHLLPDLTVRENVLMPARIAGGLRRADEDHALELIELVGMQHRLKHLPNELSGGERQRVALARALINRPGLLLCDEPSGNLDAGNSAHLHALLTDLNKRLGVAILVVTHDRGLADLASRHYVMKDGGLHLEREDGPRPGRAADARA